MTSNQISYWNLQETKRNNAARLEEETRKNKRAEELQLANLEELRRHQKQVEAETNRANLEAEALKRQGYSLNQFQNLETQRHNQVSETQNLLSLSNQREALQFTGQQAQAALMNAVVNQQNAATRRFEAQTGRYSQTATAAHQRAQEQQAAMEYLETQRHNRKAEQVSVGSVLGNLVGSLGSAAFRLLAK